MEKVIKIHEMFVIRDLNCKVDKEINNEVVGKHEDKIRKHKLVVANTY